MSGPLHEDRCTFVMCHWILLRMIYIAEKFCRENQNTIIFPRKSHRLWNNVIKSGAARQTTDDNILWRTLIACWINKAHSEYVILFYTATEKHLFVEISKKIRFKSLCIQKGGLLLFELNNEFHGAESSWGTDISSASTIPPFYGNRKFFTKFTRAHHLSYSSFRSIQSTPPPPPSFDFLHVSLIFSSIYS